MTTRYLIAAALLVGSVGGAQAGVVSPVGDPGGTAARLLYATDPGGKDLVGIYNGRRVAMAGNGNAHAATPAHAADPNLPLSATGPTHGGGAQDKGAIVVTPEGKGDTGGATVLLPIPAQHAGGGVGADLPVPPAAPAAAEPAAAVPEPSSIALMLAGMLGALGVVRRRTR